MLILFFFCSNDINTICYEVLDSWAIFKCDPMFYECLIYRKSPHFSHSSGWSLVTKCIKKHQQFIFCVAVFECSYLVNTVMVVLFVAPFFALFCQEGITILDYLFCFLYNGDCTFNFQKQVSPSLARSLQAVLSLCS
jgi:hypothetical protein